MEFRGYIDKKINELITVKSLTQGLDASSLTEHQIHMQETARRVKAAREAFDDKITRDLIKDFLTRHNLEVENPPVPPPPVALKPRPELED